MPDFDLTAQGFRLPPFFFTNRRRTVFFYDLPTNAYTMNIHRLISFFLPNSTCFSRLESANQLRVTNSGDASNKKERNMNASNTMRHSHTEREYPVHIQQALYLISGVLRRIVAKKTSQNSLPRANAHNGGA